MNEPRTSAEHQHEWRVKGEAIVCPVIGHAKRLLFLRCLCGAEVTTDKQVKVSAQGGTDEA